MDIRPLNNGTSDKVENWLAAMMEDVELMKHGRIGEKAPSTSSSSPARPRSLRNYLQSAASYSAKGALKPRPSQRGARSRGGGRGRGATKSTFHTLLPSPEEAMTVQSVEPSSTPPDRAMAMPLRLDTSPQVLPPPSTPSRPSKPTVGLDRRHVPSGPALDISFHQQQGNNSPPGMMQPFRPNPLRAPQNPLELAIWVTDLPRCYTTWMVYQLFERYGNINYISIDRETRRTKVVFRPAPQDISWVGPKVPGAFLDADGNPIHFHWQAREYTRSTPLHKSMQGNHVYPEQIVLPLDRIDFGTMKSENVLLIMNSISGSADNDAALTLDMHKMRMRLTFGIKMPATRSEPAVIRNFMVQLDIAQMHEMVLVRRDGESVSVILTVDHPPEVYRKSEDIEETHDIQNDDWNEYSAWYRQTDIDTDPRGRNSPIHLRKTNCILDTGRWLSYRMEFSPSVATSDSFTHLCQALADHNVRADVQKNVEYVASDLNTVWAWQNSLKKPQDSPKSNSFLSDLLEMEDTIHLTFPVHYQLEVCLSLNVLKECNMSVQFLKRLATLDPHRAVKILEKVVDRKEHICNPEDIFRLHNQVSVVEKQRPGYCAKIPSATVTPTGICFSTPVLETSNRVVRHYAQHEDRFMRVKFNDEKHKGGLHSRDDRIMDEIFSRVFRAMSHGIMVGGRRYEFLAFGSSQFRDHGAYFFASTGDLTAATIRDWMGKFSHIHNVAKYISRLGLCFTTTRGIPQQVDVKRIDDVERNGYHFTDGVGKISPLLADLIADHYKFDYRPSVFQFRMAGCKGVLAVDPNLKGRTIEIRPSQEKFPAEFHGLEIAKTSKFTSANLNVQLILVLSTLGIVDGVFMDKLMTMLADMEKAMTDESTARRLLEKNIDYSQMTLSLSQAIGDGFMETQEPFIISWLHLWRSWSLKYLQEKQRILIEQGAYVFGVTDETGTLMGYFEDGGKAFDEERKGKKMALSSQAKSLNGDAKSQRSDTTSETKSEAGCGEQSGDEKSDIADDQEPDETLSLPEIFIQVPNPDAKGGYTVIEAICILTRSPTLHAGDVRVVRAVDVPALHHLRDCVVLPQTGDRDLANMCSGGDLDGDEYIVSWDPALIPHESVWKEPAMDFSTAKPPPREGPVTVHDMASFFVNHIKNDKLGQIAVAHKCWADLEDVGGVRNEKCIELAELHSQAVDYPKTGVPAKFPKRLRLPRRPHWMKPTGKSYTSQKVIGQLYDAVNLDNFKPAWELPFDERILSACVPSQQNLDDAKEVKDLYDEAMRRIMAQYGIKNEFEVFTTFVQVHNPELSDYKFSETIDEVSSGLRAQFMEQCYEKAGTNSSERNWDKMKPFIVAMYTVTAHEVGDAVAESKQMVERGGRLEPRRTLHFGNVPFMSFPWIFARDLASIAKGRNGNTSLGYQTAKARPTLPKDKKLTKAQDMAARFGELEPLAEVHMPGGETLYAGDVMNLHHEQDWVENGDEALEVGRDRSNNDKQVVSTEDVAMANDLLSSMENGDLQKSAKQLCEENPEEVSFAIPAVALPVPASTEMEKLVKAQSNNDDGMKAFATADEASSSKQATIKTKSEQATVNVAPLATTALANVSESEAEEEEEVEIAFDETPSNMLDE